MIRSKASAALLRLKEIDKKYRVRHEDPKQELSSDNTESLLRQPVEEKTNTQPASVIEEQEILKPTLNIKIPDTFTEQLESQSSSDAASLSARVPIVDETPIAETKNDSQSISEIQEELEDAESISEMLEDSDNSASESVKKSPKEEIGKSSQMKDEGSEIAGKNLSMGKDQLENYVSVLNESHSNDYSHCSFESYSSDPESHSKSVSESDVHEANNSISAPNANKYGVFSSGKGILDTRKFAENIEERKEEITAKFADNVEKKREEKTAKFAESIEKSKEEKTAKFAENIEKKIEEKTAKFAENMEKKIEVKTAKFAESIEEDNGAIKSEDIDEDDEIVEESSKSIEATDTSRNISRESEPTPQGKSKSKQSKNENLQIKKQEDQEEDNSFDTKLPRDQSKKKDLEITDKRDLRTELLSGLKGRISSRKKSEENIRKVSKINDEMESEKEFNSYLETEILSREKSERKIKKRKDPENAITKQKEEITSKFTENLEKNNKVATPEDTDEIDEEIEELSESVNATDSFRPISENSEDIAGSPCEESKSKRSKRKNLKIKKQENEEEEICSTRDENSFEPKLPRDKSKKKILENKDRRTLREQLSSHLKSPNSSRQKSEENISKRKVAKINDELEEEKQFTSSEENIFSREKIERNKNKLKDSADGISGKSERSSSSLLDANANVDSTTKSSQDRSRTTDFEVTDKTEKEEKSSSSAKEDFPHRKLDNNNETALFSRAYKTKRTSSQLLRGPRRYIKKSSDYSEEVGNVPAVDGGLEESSSRRITSQRNLALRLKDAEKRFSKSVDKNVQRSQSAVEIGETRERKNLTTVRRKKLHQNSRVYGYMQEKNRSAKTSKSSTCCRIKEVRQARKDMELERFNMRLRDLRLEQERQLMLCYMRDFKEDRFLLWPNRLYCAGKPEAAILKPLKFQNVLKFEKPDSTTAKVGLIFPDNHLAMLKDRVVEIRQWLKDQFILYQGFSDVAAAINAKYVAESEKMNC